MQSVASWFSTSRKRLAYAKDSKTGDIRTDIIAARVIKALCRLCQRKKYHAVLYKTYEDLRGPFVTNRRLPGKTEQAKSSILDTSKIFNLLVWCMG